MNRKPGDWNCPSCQHLNFSRRDTCQRCSDARPGGVGGAGGGAGGRGDDYGYGGRNGGGGSYGFGSGYTSGGGGGGGDFGRSYGGGFGFGGSSDMGVRPGDWYCSAGGCGAHNFASRNNCFKCGAYKEEGAGGMPPQGYEGVSRGSRGSFGFGAGNSAGGGRQGWKSGDWICGRSGCNEHNFASRMECYRCSAPRESGTAM